MKKFVVTLTRDFGSLGRPIARRLSEILGIEYYDRDIVEATSKRLKLPVRLVSTEEEKGSSFFKMLFPLGTDSAKTQDKIFEVQSSIIRDLADKNSCIIVGRCADYILSDYENAVHIYIYGSYEQRYKNCTEVLGMTGEEAKKMIAEVDKARRSFHRQYAKYELSDPAYKDIMINSGSLGVEGTAVFLADYLKKKFETDNP